MHSLKSTVFTSQYLFSVAHCLNFLMILAAEVQATALQSVYSGLRQALLLPPRRHAWCIEATQ